jgi:hypothetical protein
MARYSSPINVSYKGHICKFVMCLEDGHWIWWDVEYSSLDNPQELIKDRDVIYSLLRIYNASYTESGLTLAEFVANTIGDK